MNERTLQLRDGERVSVRPMQAEDAEAVLAGFAGLSPASLRSRFFTPVPRLTRELGDDLVRIDDDHRLVLLAFGEDGHLAGEARALRTDADPTVAEVAITITDDDQHRGLGTKFLRHLAAVARAEGIARFTGHVLVDNLPARTMLARNGAVSTLAEPGVLDFTIVLGQPATAPAPRREAPIRMAS